MICTTALALPVRARTRSHLALRLYPGAIGELLARELRSWAEFGHRLGGHDLVTRLVDHLDELDASRDEVDIELCPPLPYRTRTRSGRPVPTDVTGSLARLRHPELRTALYAALYARRTAYPGPVGEFVARELNTYIDTDMHLGPSALLRRVLDELLTFPGAPRPGLQHGTASGPAVTPVAA